MSHQPERKEKNCLNCGAIVQGRYCHVCGQENIVTKQNFWGLTKHFIYDVFHFDGKFFDTVKYLFIKPGFVPKEYIKGRRNSYLDPIRMYLFTSAFFFLIFFKFMNPGFKGSEFADAEPLSKQERLKMINKLTNKLDSTASDSVIYKKLLLLRDTTKAVSNSELDSIGSSLNIMDRSYRNKHEYDSIQNALPSEKRDNSLTRKLTRKLLQVNEKYDGRSSKMLEAGSELFLHSLPYMLFISLPFFALLLKLLYMRRKDFYYSDHAVFTLYHYIFSFILLLVLFVFTLLQDWLHWGLFNWLITLLIFYGGYYLLRSMKSFYQQRWGKTVVKFLLLNFLGFIVLLILFLVFIVFSFFEL
ncbi:MAG: DUF3667 domain-containing protein [Flavisolibacter sp.]